MSTTDDTNADRRGSGSNDLLGPLPEAAGFSAGTHDGTLFTLKRSTGKNFAIGMREPLCEWYSAEQMRAYAVAAAAAERERCAKLCEEMGAATWWPNEARDMADLLRKMVLAGPNG